MFDLEKKIENITGGYSLLDNSLFVSSNGLLNKYSLDNFRLISSNKVQKDFQEIGLLGNSVIGLSNDEIKYFDRDLNLIESQPFELGIGDFSISSEGKVVVAVDYDYSVFLLINGLFDLKQKEVLWNGNKGDNLKMTNGQIFGVSKNKVSNLNLIKGSINWSIEYEEEQTIPVIYYGNEESVLIGFDRINQLRLINGKSSQIVWSIDSFNKGIQVDPENGFIHQFLIGYVRFSLETGEMLARNVNRDYYSEIEIESQRSNYALDRNHIYTTDWKKGIMGSFCLEKLKFDWVYRIDSGNFPSTTKIIWRDPYLLAKDSNNNLYIFKKLNHIA